MLADRAAAAAPESSKFAPVNTTEENPAPGGVPVKAGAIPPARVPAKAAMGASHVVETGGVPSVGFPKVAVRAPKRAALAASPVVVGAMTIADA